MAPKQQYQIFTNNYVNREHKECLLIMSSTHQGKKQFNDLQQYLLNFDGDKLANELSKIFIFKLDEKRIQIMRNEVQDDQSQLFLNFKREQQYEFKRIGLLQRRVKKVLYNIGNKQGKTLLLLPNQEIIKTNMNIKKNIILEKKNQIFYSANSQNLINFGENFNFNLQDHCYIGELHPTYFIPQNQGIITSRQGNNQIYFLCNTYQLGLPQRQFYLKNIQNNLIIETKGYMYDGILHGQCEKQYNGQEFLKGNYCNGLRSGTFIENGNQNNYHNGTLVNYIPQITQYQPDRSLLNFKDLNVSMNQLRNLIPGGWLNQIVVDYYIQRFMIEYKVLHHNKNPSQLQTSNLPFETVVVDTRETSDIFSSEITLQNYISFENWKNIVNEKKITNKKRIIFLFNVDRGHFMQAVYEDGKIIVINSLQSSSDRLVAERLFSLLAKDFNLQVRQFPLKQVTQQPNGYDCGIYTLYYTIKIIKNPNQLIENIDLKVSIKQIQEFRLQITKELLMQNQTMMKIGVS